MFAYGDTQRYRLGVNFTQLPTNRCFYTYNPTKRDGAANIMNYGDRPNYIPAVNGPRIIASAQYEERAAHEEWLGTVVNFESAITDDDFVQPREFWHELGKTPGQQDNLVYNVAVDLYGAITSVRFAAYGELTPTPQPHGFYYTRLFLIP
jgi:catalase